MIQFTNKEIWGALGSLTKCEQSRRRYVSRHTRPITIAGVSAVTHAQSLLLVNAQALGLLLPIQQSSSIITNYYFARFTPSLLQT